MGAPYPPMNPSWAAGFQRQFGRAPSQGDWERQIDRNRGIPEKPNTASQVAPYAGIAGSVLGMYGASQLPGLFSAGTAAASTAAPAVAGIAGTGGATLAAPEVVGANIVGSGATGTGIYGSIAAAAPYAIPVAGAALLGKGVYDLVQGEKTKGLGGWGGRAQLAVTTGGLSELARAFGLFGEPQTQVEEKRWKELGEEGYTVPDWVAAGTDIKEKGAWSRPDLDPSFVGYAPTAGEAVGIGSTPEGTWVNNAFAKSRQESDLRPEDIWGYAAMPEMFGKDYMATSEANRRAIAQKALDLGLVDEHHGTIDIKEDPALKEYWAQLLKDKEEEKTFYNKGR